MLFHIFLYLQLERIKGSHPAHAHGPKKPSLTQLEALARIAYASSHHKAKKDE